MDPRLIEPSLWLVVSILVILFMISATILILRRKFKADMRSMDAFDPEKIRDEMETLAAVKIAQRKEKESRLAEDRKSKSDPSPENNGYIEGEPLIGDTDS